MKIKYIYDKTGVNCIKTGIWRKNDVKDITKEQVNFLLKQYPGWFEVITPEKKKDIKKPLNQKSTKTK